MAAITTRIAKGTPLTTQETDNNFINLNNELVTTTKNGVAWAPTTAITLGDVIFFENRYYLVTTAGTTSSTGPVHTTGTSANGTAQLQFYVPTPYIAKDVLNKIKTVDGVGSGLDADLLDGLNATQIIEQAVSDSLALAIALG